MLAFCILAQHQQSHKEKSMRGNFIEEVIARFHTNVIDKPQVTRKNGLSHNSQIYSVMHIRLRTLYPGH